MFLNIEKSGEYDKERSKEWCPAWVAQKRECRTHDLVVASSTPVEANFLFDEFSPLTSAETCEKSSGWLWTESCISTGVRKPGNTCVSPTAMI